MRDADVVLRWRYLLVQVPLIVGLLMIVGAVRGGPLLSSTALVALPIAFGFLAVVFAYIKHRERHDPGHAEERFGWFYVVMLVVALASAVGSLVGDPSWWNLVAVVGLGAAAYVTWRGQRRARSEGQEHAPAA